MRSEAVCSGCTSTPSCGFQPIGGLVTGWLAAAGGTALAFAVGGAVTLVATGVALVRLGEVPRLRVAHTFTRT